jgi:hypothetical protein
MMLAPNPQAEVVIRREKRDRAAFFEKFVFAAVLVVAYAIAAAVLVYPVVMYVFW